MAISALSGSNSAVNSIHSTTEQTKKKTSFLNSFKGVRNIALAFKRAKMAVTRFSTMLFRKLFRKQSTTKASFSPSAYGTTHANNINNQASSSLPLTSRIIPINLHNQLKQADKESVVGATENNSAVAIDAHLTRTNQVESLNTSFTSVSSMESDTTLMSEKDSLTNVTQRRSSLSQSEDDETNLNDFITSYAKKQRGETANPRAVLYNSFLSNNTSVWENDTYQSTIESDSLDPPDASLSDTLIDTDSLMDDSVSLIDTDSDASSFTDSLEGDLRKNPKK